MMATSKTSVLLGGLAYVESARWHDNRLWFAHWGTEEIVAVDLEGSSEVVAQGRPGLGWSIDWLPDGRLLVTGEELSRREPDGTMVRHADLRGVSEYGWNEIVVDGNGNAYVNGPGFDMMGGGEFAPGIIALLRPDGSAETVGKDVAFPNGMAVTPDGSKLIVADSYAKELIGFEIKEDGRLANRTTWADLGDGVPDGICIDAEGAVWYADVPNKRCVRVREGGEVLQTIEVDRGCFACMLGGADGRTLFMTAQEWNGPEGIFNEPRTGQVLAIEAPAAHAGHP